jgi:hypothetical protein
MPRIELTLSLTGRRTEGLRTLAGFEDLSLDAYANQVLADHSITPSLRRSAKGAGNQPTDE